MSPDKDWKEKLKHLETFVRINAHYFVPAVKIAIILQFYIGYFFVNGSKLGFFLVTIYLLVLMGIHIYFISQHYDMLKEIREVESFSQQGADNLSISAKIDEIFRKIVNTPTIVRNYCIYFIFFILINPPSLNKKYSYFANLIWCILMAILMLLPETILYLSQFKKREVKALLP